MVYSFMKIKVEKKIDFGSIMLEVTQEDKEALANVIQQGGFEEPAVKMSIYKNRRGRYKDILLWCRAQRGICRIEPMFATNYQYELIQIDDVRISIKEESAF